MVSVKIEIIYLKIYSKPLIDLNLKTIRPLNEINNWRYKKT